MPRGTPASSLQLSILALLALGVPLGAQQAPRLIARYGDIDLALVFLRAAATTGSTLAVVGTTDPAITVVDAGRIHTWGRKGEGPAELSAPTDVAWAGTDLLVLDTQSHKIVSYTHAGEFRSSRSLNGMWANRLAVVAGDTLLQAFVPFDEKLAVVRVRGVEVDTLLVYARRGEATRLEAPDAPSLSVRPPFWPQVAWTILADGSLAVWEPDEDAIRLLDDTGREFSRVVLSDEPEPVTQSDRERWLSDTFDGDFLGQRPFRPLKEVALEEVSFPDRLPAVMRLVGDPNGGIWILHTTAGNGQRWSLIERSGCVRGEFRLPPGRDLLAVGELGLVAHAADDFEIEYVEVFERPEWTAMPCGS